MRNTTNAIGLQRTLSFKSWKCFEEYILFIYSINFFIFFFSITKLKPNFEYTYYKIYFISYIVLSIIVTYHVCHFDGFSGCICVLELRQLQIKRWWLIVGKCGWTDLYSLDMMVITGYLTGEKGLWWFFGEDEGQTHQTRPTCPPASSPGVKRHFS